MDDPGKVGARLRVMTVIWLGLTGGVVTFAAVVYGLLTMGAVSIGAVPRGTINVIGPILIAMMAAGLLVGHRMEDRIPADAEDEDKVNAYLAARIVAMAMQEAPGLVVITLSLMAGTPNWALVGAGVSVYTMFLARPRRDAVERLLRSQGG